MKDIKLFAFADEADGGINGQIAAMKRNGLDGLEIRRVDGAMVSDISLEKAKEVKQKLDDNDLITWSIGSPIGKIGINDPFDEHLEKFKHTLEIAKTLDAKNIRLFSFYIPNGENIEGYKNKVIDRLGQLLKVAEGSDIILCHENEKGIYGDIPERCLQIHESLPELKGIFDPANYIQCGVDTLKAWELLKQYIGYMHIKDCKKSGFVVPSGFGDANIKEISKQFIAGGGNSFTIEPHLTIFKGFEELENGVTKSEIPEFEYTDSNIAFDVACNSFKSLII